MDFNLDRKYFRGHDLEGNLGGSCVSTLIALEIFYWSPALRVDTAPKQDPKYIANYENLLLKHSDQRLAWRPNISTETFNIAWISGSSAILRNKNRLFDNKTRYTLPYY